MKNIIKIKVKTLSNLFIGGAPMPFEIGGIDQWTAVDEEGYPCIPASSLKGALRAIVAGEKSKGEVTTKIAQWYAELLSKEMERNWEQIEECYKDNKDVLGRVKERYEEAIKNASVGNLFGIREFNNTPKLLFNDLQLVSEYRDLKKCFSIDTKTSINASNRESITSNPRTYKTARKGLVFEGEIEFYQFEFVDEEILNTCKTCIIENLKKFNDGIYRLGNSKSRGYGKVCVSIIEEE